ncbi:MAG: hypothetical protein AAF589_09025 [Planctomycetota bacterium]
MLARSSVLLSLLLIAAIGCQDAKAPAIDAALLTAVRERVLLAEEPTTPAILTPEELREQLTAGEEANAEANSTVCVVGQIGGVPNPWKEAEPNFPWRQGEATFFLVDPAAAAEFADHSKDDPDHAKTCPFCAGNAGDNADSVAVVTLADDAGKSIALGANELLSLDQDAVVVVQGRAKLAGELLIVEADGLYVRE